MKSSAQIVHERVLAGIRQLAAEPGLTPAQRRQREARLAEIEAYGRQQGWNEEGQR
jgi:hypothetical protein